MAIVSQLPPNPSKVQVEQKLRQVIDALTHNLSAIDNFAAEGAYGEVLTSKTPSVPTYESAGSTITPADLPPHQHDVSDLYGTFGRSVLPSEIAYEDEANIFQVGQTFLGAILVDNIGEVTTDGGVVIDGVLLKDGLIGWSYVDKTGANLTDIPTRNHNDLQNIGTDDHHPQVHALVGADHTATGLTTGYVVRASGATTFAWAQLQYSDLGGIPSSFTPSAHALESAGGYHTASGLTTGHVLRASGSTSFAFAAIQSGDLPSHTHAASQITAGTFGSGAFTFQGGKVTFPASTTTYASIRLTSAAGPTSPVAGDVWYNASNLLRYYDGTAKRTVANLLQSQTFQNKTMSTSCIWNGNAIGTAYGGAPSGGSTGYVLTKNSATNYDYSWQAATGGGISGSGTTNTITKWTGTTAVGDSSIYDDGSVVTTSVLVLVNNVSSQTFTSQAQNLGVTLFQDTAGADAFMTFHVSNDFAAYFGVGGSENDFVVGGWSFGVIRYRVLHTGNMSTLYGLTYSAGVLTESGVLNVTGTNGLAVGAISGRRRIDTTDAITFRLLGDSDGYADLYLRSLYVSSGAGVYFGGSTTLWRNSATELLYRSDHATDATISLRSSDSTQRGAITADGSNVGLLIDSGAWGIAISHTSKDVLVYGHLTIGTGVNNKALYMADTAGTDIRVMTMGGDNNLYVGAIDNPTANGNIIFRTQGTDRMHMSSTAFYPITSGAMSVGGSGNRFVGGYFEQVRLIGTVNPHLGLNDGTYQAYLEIVSGVLRLYHNGAQALGISTSQEVNITAGKKFYLDGGGDTYLVETSSDLFELYVGGNMKLQFYGATGSYINVPTGQTLRFSVNTASRASVSDIAAAGSPGLYADRLAYAGGSLPALSSTTGITSGAGGNTGTLTNSPVTGNPTVWIPINDNGTTRYIPAW